MKNLVLLIAISLLALGTAQTERAEWHSIELSNALTGETYTLADFDGKTVFVEPMATWCSNCTKQLNNVSEAKMQFEDDVIFIALSVEGNLADEKFAEYAERRGWDFIYSVATPELLQGLVDEFGRTVLSPPSTPHFIISPDGSVSELTTGIEPADLIAEQITAAQN